MTRATYADYLTWDGDQRWEIIDGQPYAMSSPTTGHQALQSPSFPEIRFDLGEIFNSLPQ